MKIDGDGYICYADGERVKVEIDCQLDAENIDLVLAAEEEASAAMRRLLRGGIDADADADLYIGVPDGRDYYVARVGEPVE